ncbi:MAG: FAD:protein FMN transferase [Actinomycetales bacterium]|nr:FAD:protein FMN transferase [Actinomycetales bacterium]
MSLTVQVDVMGTVVTLSLFHADGLDAARAQPFFDEAEYVLREVDRVFSTYRPESPVSRLRRGEMALGEAPPEVAEVLDLCREAREVTGGWFDPWAMPGGVDPTGLVKGWAAGRALSVLVAAGTDGALVNAAGDLASHGVVAPGQAFRAGIADPAAPGTLAAIVNLDGALATSGTYERGSHLLNPHTRVRESAVASASVTGPDPALVDACATALCVGGDAVFDLLGDVDGYEALVVGFDGSQRHSAGFDLVAAGQTN